MPIIAKKSSEKVYPNIEQLNILEKHSKHSDFHESILSFWIKNGFITEKQERFINKCNQCRGPRGYYEYDIGGL